MPNIGRALEELASEVGGVQKARIANQLDATLWKEHPAIDTTTATMLNGRATRYLSQQTTGPKPTGAIAYFGKEDFERSFGKVDVNDADAAEKIRNYYWQLKTGDGIEDLVVAKAKRGAAFMTIEGIEGREVAAAMWRVDPKAKVPVFIDAPSVQWGKDSVGRALYQGKEVALDLPKYQTGARKPTFTLDTDSKMGRMTFDPSNPQTGDIATMERGSDSRQIVMSFVPEKYRGTGRGIAMYEQLATQTLSEGKKLVSDTQVSPDAARMYDALEKRGFKVIRNEFETDEDGLLRSTSSRPIFEVVPEKKKVTSPTLSKQAESTVPGDSFELSDSGWKSVNDVRATLTSNADKNTRLSSVLKAAAANLTDEHPMDSFYKKLIGKLEPKLGDKMRVSYKSADPENRNRYGAYQDFDVGRGHVSLFPASTFSNSEFLHTLVHESVHAVTLRSIRENSKLSETLDDLVRNAKFDPNVKGKHYGLKNAAEFVAEIEANKEFQDLMKKATVVDKQGSVWDNYVKAIAGVLGVAATATNLDQLSDVLEKPDERTRD